MTYKVLLHPKAAKTLQKLDDINKKRIKNELVELANDPYKIGEPLILAVFWKIRIGDYEPYMKLIALKKRSWYSSWGTKARSMMSSQKSSKQLYS